jgi:hypothetical protein
MAGSALRITFATAAAAVAFPAVAAATKTHAGVIAVPLSRDEGLTAYFAKLQVGTPPQTQFLKIDTGSPRYSFLDPHNEVCQRDGDPCHEFGTFNNETSSYVPYYPLLLSVANIYSEQANIKALVLRMLWVMLARATI